MQRSRRPASGGRKRLCVLLAGAWLASAAGAQTQDAALTVDAAVAQVDAFHAALREAAALAACTEREAALADSVGRYFDIPGIAHRLLRGAWSELEKEQRRRFAQKLQILTASGYSANFDDPATLGFTDAELRREAEERVVVRSTLKRGSGGDALGFDYLLEAVNGSWRITNVSVDGVSKMTVRAAQYGQIARDSGVETLLTRMDEQIRQMRRACSEDDKEAE